MPIPPTKCKVTIRKGKVRCVVPYESDGRMQKLIFTSDDTAYIRKLFKKPANFEGRIL